MKRVLSLILFSLVVVALSVSGITAYFTYENNITTAANVVKFVHLKDEKYDQDVKVEIYARVYHEKEHAPVFAISELVNKSIDYRIKHPEATDMTIDSSFYRVEPDTACYYKKGTRDYGKMTILKDKDQSGDCERVMYGFIKAAKYGIHTKVMWHIEKDIHGVPVIDYFNRYMDQECIFDPTKHVSDFLEVKHSTWENSGISQMHNKQVLVSNYLDYDGTEYADTVYTATSNVDYYRAASNLPVTYKDWAHTGFVVSNHPYVYGSNKKYFDICFEHADNRFEFANKVFELHNKGDYLHGGLNYVDENFECYFTPLSQEGAAQNYDVNNNPVAKYIEKLNESEGKIECFANQYFIGSDVLITKFVERLHDAFTNNKTEGNRFGVVQNNGLAKDNRLNLLLEEIGEVRSGKMTHAKDIIFHYADTEEYVVVTGSTNWGLSNFFGQSNTMMVFKEKGNDHQIYDCFLENYSKTVSSKK